jgi:capsular exopolysaccharide synthesis family protein
MPEYGATPRTEIITYPKNSPNSVPRVLYLEPLNQDTSGDQGEQSVSFQAWRAIVKRLPWVIVMFFLGLIAGLSVSLSETPLYQSTVSLEIQNPNEGPVNLPMADLQAEASAESYLPTQAVILQSRMLREKTLAKLSSQKLQQNRTNPPSGFLGHLLRRKSATTTAASRALAPVETKVTIEQNTRIVNVLCSSPDPQVAAGYANTLANVYIDANLQARWDAINHARQWLSEQLDESRKKLQDSENQLTAYERASNLMFVGDKESAEQEKLKEVQAALAEAQAARIEKQSAYQTASSTPADAVPQVLDNVRLSQYQAQIADLRRELAELSSQYTPQHPKVQRLQAQIDQVESTFQAERQNVLTRIRSEYQAALVRENLLSAAYRKEAGLVSEQTQQSTNYNILERDVETNRQLYGLLLQKAREADIATAMRGSNIRIVDTAQVPQQPYKPDPIWYTISGSVSGLALGLVLVVVREGLDHTFKGPGEAPFHLKVPELGVIPSGGLEAGNGPARLTSGLHFAGAKISEENTPTRPVELVTWDDKSSNMAESFRGTLTSILHSAENSVAPRVILVTSATRGEGKTTVVSNLGIALAEINQRVLLIDADMRKPRLGEIFGIESGWGLSDLLREQTSLRDCPLEALIQSTHIPNLSILPSGPSSSNITNLLYSTRMMELLQRLRCDFDSIVIDTPPMLPITDARILGRLSDGVILVFRAGKTHRDAAGTAKRRLADDGVPVLGTILNAWDAKNSSRYPYDAYEYYKTPR